MLLSYTAYIARKSKYKMYIYREDCRNKEWLKIFSRFPGFTYFIILRKWQCEGQALRKDQEGSSILKDREIASSFWGPSGQAEAASPRYFARASEQPSEAL